LKKKRITIEGKQLKCSFCDNNHFYELNVKLNTFSTSFFSGFWSFFATNAKAYICSKCGKKQEFVEP
jgi:hypothetical protein